MTADERRLLHLLVGSADGCTDAVLTAQGFKLDVLISIVSAEFATAKPERTLAAGKAVKSTQDDEAHRKCFRSPPRQVALAPPPSPPASSQTARCSH